MLHVSEGKVSFSCLPLSLGSVFLRLLSLPLSLEKVLFSRGSAIVHLPLLLLLLLSRRCWEESGVSNPAGEQEIELLLHELLVSSFVLRAVLQEMNSSHSFPNSPFAPLRPMLLLPLSSLCRDTRRAALRHHGRCSSAPNKCSVSLQLMI